MKKINKGDYVRVKYMWDNEKIARVEKVLDKDPCYYNMQMYKIDEVVQHSNAHYPSTKIYDEDIIAHSPRISKLLKKGDYVNGLEVLKVEEDPFIKGQIDIFLNGMEIDYYGNGNIIRILDDDIREILTKQQYKKERYEVKKYERI